MSSSATSYFHVVSLCEFYMALKKDIIFKFGRMAIPKSNLISLSIRKITLDLDTSYLIYLASVTLEIRSHIPKSNQFIRDCWCIIPQSFIKIGPEVWAVSYAQE